MFVYRYRIGTTNGIGLVSNWYLNILVISISVKIQQENDFTNGIPKDIPRQFPFGISKNAGDVHDNFYFIRTFIQCYYLLKRMSCNDTYKKLSGSILTFIIRLFE